MSDLGGPETFLKDIFAKGWQTFIQDAVLYILAFVILAVLSTITFGILSGPLMVGFINVVKKRLSGEEASPGDVFSGFSSFFGALFTLLIIAIGVAIGTFFLIIPGLAVAWVTMFAFHCIAYRDDGIGGALNGSYNVIREHAATTLVLFIIVAIINAVGGVIVVGCLLTGPFAMVTLTVAFEDLTRPRLPHSQAGAPGSSLPPATPPGG